MKLIKEHINFKRGLDPKDAMLTGNVKLRQLLKRAEETKDVGNGLYASEDLEWHFYDWHDVLPEHLDLLIKILKERHPKEPISHIKYCINAYWDDEWAVNESNNFTRGLDPKSAMGTGRYGVEAIIKLNPTPVSGTGYSFILDKEDVYNMLNTFPDGTIDIKVGKKHKVFQWGKHDIRYWRQDADNRWKKIEKMAWDMGAGVIRDSKDKLHPIEINEAQNFQRGLDPKDAMGIGMSSKFPEWNLFHLIYQESCDSDNFEYISPIDYKNKEPMFHIESKFIYAKSNDNDVVKPKMYTIYLTKDEGVLFFDDNTHDEKEIIDLQMFNKVTWCYDIDELDESMKFKRGLEPKDAMGTGNVRRRELIKLLGEAHLWNSCGPDYPRNVIEEVSGLIDTPINEIYCMHEEDLSSKWDDFLSVFWYDDDGSQNSDFKIIEWQDRKFRHRVVFNCSKKLKMAYDGSGHASSSSMVLFNMPSYMKKLTLTETQHFKRGLEPKEAMGTGLSKFQLLHIEIIAAMTKIAKNNEITDLSNENQIYIAFNNNGLRYIMIYDEVLDSSFGSIRILQQTKMANRRVRSFDKRDIEMAIKKIKEWIRKDELDLDESYNFKRGLDPKEAMRTGEKWKENLVKNLLVNLKNDFQLDPKDDRYLGFINCYEDGFMTQEDKDGFKMFIETWPKYQKLMKQIGLDLGNRQQPDIEETVFVNSPRVFNWNVKK